MYIIILLGLLWFLLQILLLPSHVYLRPTLKFPGGSPLSHFGSEMHPVVSVPQSLAVIGIFIQQVFMQDLLYSSCLEPEGTMGVVFNYFILYFKLQRVKGFSHITLLVLGQD